MMEEEARRLHGTWMMCSKSPGVEVLASGVVLKVAHFSLHDLESYWYEGESPKLRTHVWMYKPTIRWLSIYCEGPWNVGKDIPEFHIPMDSTSTTSLPCMFPQNLGHLQNTDNANEKPVTRYHR